MLSVSRKTRLYWKQGKIWLFLHRLIKHTASAHVYVSPWSSWFILGAMSPLGHVIFIWFRFKKRTEMKKKISKKKKTKTKTKSIRKIKIQFIEIKKSIKKWNEETKKNKLKTKKTKQTSENGMFSDCFCGNRC